MTPDHERPATASPTRGRARARHILDHYYIGPARDPAVLEIWGYTPRMSYEPGETVDLHVSTTAMSWDLEVGRDGLTYEPLLEARDLPGVHHPTPGDCSVAGCGWPVGHSFTVPENWPPGAYLITLRASRGSDRVEEHHLILVRRARHLPPAPYIFLCATGTWMAYNCWGGSNHYEGITGPDGNAASPILSSQRPWTRGFCKLPAGAPRTVPDTPPRPGEMVRYAYMEWAYAYGYSKKFASAGWATYERHFARWAEAAGYEIDFATLHDLEAMPELLKGHRCVISVGHDEYWSTPMRDAVDSFVDAGGRVARFAGNFLWQIRLEDEGRRQVCYKYDAQDRDPLMGTAQEALVTGAWEGAPLNRPGALSFGANALRGVYAHVGRATRHGSGGFTIYRPDHWAFAGTALGYGDLLGAGSRVFGYEVDGLDHRFEDGLPYPTGTDGADSATEILAMGIASMLEHEPGIWGETLYIGDTEQVLRAKALHGAVTPETMEASTRGNGVIIHWHKGRGEVFNAATCEWVMGLARGDAEVIRVTRNVLDRFGAT